MLRYCVLGRVPYIFGPIVPSTGSAEPHKSQWHPASGLPHKTTQTSDRGSTPRPQHENTHKQTQTYIPTTYGHISLKMTCSRISRVQLTYLQMSWIYLLLLWAIIHNDGLPHQQWFPFPEGQDIFTLSAHYLSYMQLYSDIWLHGDTYIYPLSCFLL